MKKELDSSALGKLRAVHLYAVRTRTKVPRPQCASRPPLDGGTDGSSSDPRPAKPETTVGHLGQGTEAAKTGLPYPRPSQFIQSLYDLAALRILVSLQEQGELGTAA
ncbi:hypothetical protein J1605_011000 [Eschrichtius robustus]|uniref:Uncharacterized protein n=1 Tax=Eschrichtius robustus TaxID=9764 RepID=A0AB34GPQ2_ESCRO|nr:hypothetical protein J1605_011000 [Eschrichtius robustus]